MNLGQLGGQRDRWHRGLTDTLVRHRRMIFNPRYGVVGLVGLPFFVLFEFLGAFIEAVGYIVLPLGFAFGYSTPGAAALFFRSRSARASASRCRRCCSRTWRSRSSGAGATSAGSSSSA